MKVGEIELRVPQERSGPFSTRVFEHYQRSEKALVAVLSEMYVQGVSTRRVSRLAEGLCGHEFSPATISAMVSQASSCSSIRRQDPSRSRPFGVNQPR